MGWGVKLILVKGSKMIITCCGRRGNRGWWRTLFCILTSFVNCLFLSGEPTDQRLTITSVIFSFYCTSTIHLYIKASKNCVLYLFHIIMMCSKHHIFLRHFYINANSQFFYHSALGYYANGSILKRQLLQTPISIFYLVSRYFIIFFK